MLKNAKKKFPKYTFKVNDCSKYFSDNCDILVSIFGTPNYIGLRALLSHYHNFNGKHAFFIFYNEDYDDGFGERYYKYTKKELETALRSFDPIIKPLNKNYYIVKW